MKKLRRTQFFHIRIKKRIFILEIHKKALKKTLALIGFSPG
ncbi:hypothetical protein [Treponema sp.]|nr:hypothetical protein [Treponema sp.]